MQKFEDFAQYLIDKPELYDNYNSFYIRMRNADKDTKDAYDKIKNGLMSYFSRTDKNDCVHSELGPREEVFTVGTTIARFLFSGGQLYVHLNVDPKKQSTRDAMYRVSENQMIVYKLEKKNVIDQVCKTIPKMMASFNYISSIEYKDEEYSSFYSQNVDEIKSVVEQSQKEYEDKIQEELSKSNEALLDTSEKVAGYGDYYDNESKPRSVDSKFIARETPEGIASEDELLKAEKDRKQKKPGIAKLRVWSELASYGYEFIWLRYVEFYLAAILLGVGLSIAYQLKIPWMILTTLSITLMMPGTVKSFYRNKFEEKKYEDVTTYIEQMLYSFRKNNKIIASLRDALSVFPNGHMHDVISAAIHSVQTSMSGTNMYIDALSLIEKEYPCRRIRSLHRYMIKVEGVGGDQDAGVEALLKDRRLWIERIDAFKKDSKAILMDVYISIGFAIALACMIVRMMSTPLVNVPDNIIYQISSFVFIVICVFTIKLTLKNTVFYLEDEETETSSKRIVDKIEWLRTYNSRKELQKSTILSLVALAFLGVGLFLKNFTTNPMAMTLIILSGVALCYFVFLKRFLDKSTAIKSVTRAVEKVYPDWLLELALLLQIDNLHVAIEKTLDDAPLIIRGDLITLDEEIIKNPTSITPFSQFLDFLPMPHIQSSMKLLYSLSEFGQAKGSVQLMELVERNNSLMDKAEQYKNDDRLSATFIVKFVPMGISAMKLLVDLMLLLISYMGIISGAA